MRIPDYDEWFEKIGSDKFDDLLNSMDEFLNENNIGSKWTLQRARAGLESNEPNILIEWYEAYISEIQNYAYETMKDERCMQ